VSIIVAGRFQMQEQASGAIAALQAAGFAGHNLTSFFVNPSGQHDLFAVGGDADNSPGAHKAPGGTVKGAEAGGVVGALGAAVALAAIPAIGPVAALLVVGAGAGVGAYAGSLAGALNSLGEPVDPVQDHAPQKAEQEQTPLRKSGMLVAVATVGEPEEADAVRVLRAQGAAEIERTEGTIADGQWPDFDPLRPVVRVDPPADPGEARPVSQ
jgi:hypothetical protein